MEIVDGGWGVGGCELVVCEVILFLLLLPYFILVSVVCVFCLWGFCCWDIYCLCGYVIWGYNIISYNGWLIGLQIPVQYIRISREIIIHQKKRHDCVIPSRSARAQIIRPPTDIDTIATDSKTQQTPQHPTIQENLKSPRTIFHLIILIAKVLLPTPAPMNAR